MQENIKIKGLATSKLKIINYDNLSDHEYILCSGDEIYHKNSRDHIELENFKDTLKQLIKNKPTTNNPIDIQDVKKDVNKKHDLRNNKVVKKNVEEEKKVIDDESPKRKSFREKAKKFNSSDKPMKKSKSRKINKNLGILSKKTEEEKRQGWWTQ